MNLFLFIIWNKAYFKRKYIVDDIKKNFEVKKVIEVHWDKDRFGENISRFYGKKVNDIKFKIRACGNAPFTLVVFEDKNPVYVNRKTSRGEDEIVNANVFDKKEEYRRITSNGKIFRHSKIHGTNTVEETYHDLTLLLGMNPEDFINNIDTIPNVYKENLVGCNGFKDLKEMFYVLNNTVRYVVLRNYEGLPDDFYLDGHEDIDILADSFEETRLILNAKKVFPINYRVQCLAPVAGRNIQFDIRFLGDGYYDKAFEEEILCTREEKNGIFIPSDKLYKYMLLYHALIHKRAVADDYKTRMDNMFGEGSWGKGKLYGFLKSKGYTITEPKDLSVYFNRKYTNKKGTPLRRLRVQAVNVVKKLGIKK